MAIHEIVLLGDPVLRTEADEVTAFDSKLRGLVRDMFETMYHADGIGLAAPQIGVLPGYSWWICVGETKKRKTRRSSGLRS